VFVADAALYSADNLEALGTTPWISRVPASLIAAQTLLQTLQANLFHPSVLKGYAFAEVCTTYGGIRQRWLIVESQARKEADLKQLQKRIDQSLKEQTPALNKLQAKAFGCETDAQNAAQVFGKTLKYHALSDIIIHKTPHYAQAGRPAKEAAPVQYTYHLQASLVLNDSVVEKHRNQAGRFILATNLLDEQSWSNETLLREYKNQQSCERGFRFLKDPLFFTSSVFLKTPRRIVALAMIMGLALMVYSLGQRQLRQALQQAQATLPNQKGKPTERPTLRWILQCFQSVHLVWLHGVKHLIKLNARQLLILSFLGAECKKYYLLC
jgi:transposase